MITTDFAYADLHLDPANPRRRGITDEAIVELALVIGRRGLLNPPRVTAAGGIRGGQRRYLAIGCLIRWCDDDLMGSVLERVDGNLEQLRTFETRASELRDAVPCIVVDDQPGSEMDALIDNLHRADMLSYDVAEALVSRLNQARGDRVGKGAATLTSLSQEVGKSLSWVSRMVSTYRRACPELHQVWSSDQLPYERVRVLAELEHDQQRKALAGEAPKPHGRPGIEAVKDLRDRLRAAGEPDDFRRGVLAALAVVTGEAPPATLEQLLSA